MADVWEIKACRVCGGNSLHSVLNMGEIAINNFIESEDDKEIKAPVELLFCSGCSVLQLKHNINPDLLFRDYWYRSFTNETMRRALQSIIYDVMGKITLDKGDVVLDLGANDGTLLSFYPSWVVAVGFEPARNFVSEHLWIKPDAFIVNDYFSAEKFLSITGGKKAKIITSVAMFYDIQDPNGFILEVKKCLSDDGIWVIEMQYSMDIIAKNAIDYFVHEHIMQYTIPALRYLFTRNGLAIRDYQINDVNGGSIRLYIGYAKGWKEKKILPTEIQLGFIERLMSNFQKNVENVKTTIQKFINQELSKGKRFYAYGASTKGNTFLQYMGLDTSMIYRAVERDVRKIGRKTVATHVPIISENQARNEHPDYMLALIWQFRDAVIRREVDYLRAGGKLLFALPQPELVEWTDIGIKTTPLHEFLD